MFCDVFAVPSHRTIQFLEDSPTPSFLCAFAVQTLGIVHFLEDSLLGGDSAELVDVGGVSGAEGGEDKSPGWG